MPVMDLQRSWMFSPGNSERMLLKAIGLANLDVVMLDLEDGVPPALKDAARTLVATVLASPQGGPQRWVRINSTASDRMEGDLESVIVAGIDGVVLPKVERPDE